MQHVAKISCRNGAETVNVRKKKASLEEKNATYCKNLL